MGPSLCPCCYPPIGQETENRIKTIKSWNSHTKSGRLVRPLIVRQSCRIWGNLFYKSGKFIKWIPENTQIISLLLIPNKLPPVYSQNLGIPTYGRMWLSDRFSLDGSYVANNDVRIITVLHGLMKYPCNLSLISILG